MYGGGYITMEMNESQQPMFPYSSNGTGKKATAEVQGSVFAPNLKGYVIFTTVPHGTEMMIEVSGLPHYQQGEVDKDPIDPFGFHIHEKGTCERLVMRQNHFNK